MASNASTRAPVGHVTRRTMNRVGLPVDAYGDQTIDPTENVKDLMDASIRSLTREQELGQQLADEKIKRLESEGRALQKEVALRAEHAKETRGYDNERWDKTRTIDMGNAQETARQILGAVNNYAAAQERMAQTLRDQVATTADASLKSQAAIINPLADRVAALEKSTNFGAGKEQVADPMMSAFMVEMKKMANSMQERQGRESVSDPAIAKGLGSIETLLLAQTQSSGQRQGVADSQKMLTWILMIATAVLGYYTFTQQRQAPAPAPQIIFTPAPSGTLLPSSPPATVPR